MAIDNNYAIWSGFFNNYWPADYFVDTAGHIRGHQFGEGDYEGSERLIQKLLTQAGFKDIPTGFVTASGTGVEAAANDHEVQSPETYIGYSRAQNLKSPEPVTKDQSSAYSTPARATAESMGIGRPLDCPG